MIENSTDFEQLMIWLSESREIPLETRRDFFNHIQKVGRIDTQAEKFIEQALNFVSHKNGKKAAAVREKIAVLESVTETQRNPAKSFAYKLADQAAEWMLEKAENFKSWFKDKEATEMKAEETSEKSREISEVEALKAALS